MRDQFVISTFEDDQNVLILSMLGKEVRTKKQTFTNRIRQLGCETERKIVSNNMTRKILFIYMKEDITNATGIETDIDEPTNIDYKTKLKKEENNI
ncbi:hypothetical protein CHS0354_012774 [Potamilus streckersoni]|uniref:Uncharacterized protein n=1 Tax=Potamilus streckersoni TaxID=2493646 RepID=A0AAE0VKJ1_9BIVA|nr:hypothetical protein CHS0354_012774 [Potamilus streckersoni]